MTMVNLLALPGEGLKGGITMNGKIGQLRKILDDSNYTVALCGSGMMEEGGFIGIKKQDKAYDIENRYGYGVEEMYSSAFYNTRPEQFFEFLKRKCSITLQGILHPARPWPPWSGRGSFSAS